MFDNVKQYLRLASPLAILLFALPVHAATPAKQVLPIEKWQTKNGAHVYYVNLPELPIVDVDVIFNAGSAYDGSNYGLASFTSNMIGQSAKNLNADEIAEKFDDVAAIFDTQTSRDTTSVHLRSLTRKELLTPALTTFSITLNEPNFASNSFNRVKEQTMQGILQQQQTPSDIADKALFKSIYDNYPYGHPRIGTMNSIKQITPNDLSEFYKQYYVAKNANVIIVGDVSKAQAKNIANQVVGKLPAGNPAKKLVKPNYQPKNKEIHVDYPASQTYIRLGELGISRSSKDYFPLYIGNYIFGGGTLVSRLFKEVREQRGLTYGVYSFFIPYKQPGPFLITLQTRNQATDEAIKVIREQMAEFLDKGPTAPELTAAKNNIIGSFPLRLDSNSAILNQVANIAVYQLPLNYLDTYRENIDKVTIDDIKKAFNQHVSLDNLVTVTVGPEQKAKPDEQQPS